MAISRKTPHTGFRSVQKALTEAPAPPSRKTLPGARKANPALKVSKALPKMKGC